MNELRCGKTHIIMAYISLEISANRQVGNGLYIKILL